MTFATNQPRSNHLRLVNGQSGPGVLCLDADGNEFLVSVPADWAAQAAAGTPYVLGVVGGLPAFVVTTASAVDGYGSGYGDSYGQS